VEAECGYPEFSILFQNLNWMIQLDSAEKFLIGKLFLPKIK